MMTNTNSVTRKNKNSPLTGVLMVIFCISLILVVVNQVFVNVNARQEQVFSNLISDMRVSTLQMASHAAALATGDIQSRFSLSEAQSEFDANWTLLTMGRENLIPTGLGISTQYQDNSRPFRKGIMKSYKRGTELIQILP